MNHELLSLLNHELGEVVDWEELCTGIFSLGVQPALESKYPWREYYLVLDRAPVSQEARALGKPLPGTSALLYPIDPPDEAAWTAIMYELCRNGLAQGGQPLEGWSLTDAAMEGMELCPAYFGAFPVPPRTPWGWTHRHRPLDNGVYWMETDQGKTVLAVCYPIWSTELSDGVKQAGKKLPCEGVRGSEEPCYLFFEEETSCTVIFELLMSRLEWLGTDLIRKAELMNAIWKYAPAYAMAYNAEEQAGLHDGPGILLQMLGGNREPQGSPEHMIALGTEAGTDFVGFWK